MPYFVIHSLLFTTYLNLSFSRLITSVWEERERELFFFAIDYSYFFPVRTCSSSCGCLGKAMLFEPRSEKTGFLHMRKQRRRSALR